MIVPLDECAAHPEDGPFTCLDHDRAFLAGRSAARAHLLDCHPLTLAQPTTPLDADLAWEYVTTHPQNSRSNQR